MAGRPTKYKPEMCEQVIDLMRDGLAIEEVCAEMGIWKDTFYNWVKKHDEFSDAYKRGLELSKAWWLKQGRSSLTDGKFNSTLWYMNMKNRHKWSDKQEVDHTTKGKEINIPPIDWVK